MNKARHVWEGMKARCSNSESFLKAHPTYIDCSVCDEWIVFSAFEAWFNDNYIEGNELDKDLLKDGNKVYCPEYCCFVPSKLNLIIGRKGNKRSGLPMGVYADRETGMYISQVNIDSKSVHLGYFASKDLAATSYKMAKEVEVKRVAKDFFLKGLIDERVYSSLLSWTHKEDNLKEISVPDYFLLKNKEKQAQKAKTKIKKPSEYKSKYSPDYKRLIIKELAESGMSTSKFEKLKGLPLSTIGSFKNFIAKRGSDDNNRAATTKD